MHSSNIVTGALGKGFLLGLAVLAGLMAFPIPQSWAHGANGQICSVRGFAMRCFGNVLNLNTTQIAFSQQLRVSVSPSTPFQFDLGTEILLEPATGVSFGLGLVRLCSDRDPRGRPTCQALRSGNTITFDLSAFTAADRQLLRNRSFLLWSVNFARFEHADAASTITFVDQVAAPTPQPPLGPLPSLPTPQPPLGPLPSPINNTPVINGINIPRNIPVNTQVNGSINFSDANGDVVRVDFRPVFSFTGFNFNPNVLGVRNGTIAFFINCTRTGGRFSADVVLTDQAGNTSNVQRLNFNCVP